MMARIKKWTNNDKINEMLARCEQQGWRIVDGGKHVKAYPPDKTMEIVTVAKTPSDHRAPENTRRDLRHSGADL